ncbi:MAG: hypothetical protein RJB65_1110 [Actinomycetota bacterium]
MNSFVLRVWLPDRPGALGQVAGRIGAVGGDVVGIDILERGGGSAIDELTITLPDFGLVDLLISEVRQVDGVAVEDIRPVSPDRPLGGMAALQVAASIVGAEVGMRFATAVHEIRALLDADWACIVSVPSGEHLALAGELDDTVAGEWLAAFLGGSEHLGQAAHHTTGDLASVRLNRLGAALVVGRGDRVLHERERSEVELLGRILDSLA